MIRLRVIGGGFAALVLSGALHAAGLLIVMPQAPTTEIAGGGAPDIAAVGAAFEDFIAGAVPVTPAAQPAVPATAGERSLALPAASVADLAVPVAPDQPDSGPVPITATTVAVRETAPPVAPEVTRAVPDTAPLSSLRPVARPAPRAAPVQQAANARPTGNAETDATRGSARGQAQGQAATAGATSAADATGGQAAAAAYPGQVLRQITRLRAQRATARGTVLVSFAIAGSGALADVGVARSSGSVALDALALDHIRRAAPFPPPPAGAQTAFSFEFVGRP